MSSDKSILLDIPIVECNILVFSTSLSNSWRSGRGLKGCPHDACQYQMKLMFPCRMYGENMLNYHYFKNSMHYVTLIFFKVMLHVNEPPTPVKKKGGGVIMQ